MWFKKYASGYRQTYIYTNTLIAIVRTPTGDEKVTFISISN